MSPFNFRNLKPDDEQKIQHVFHNLRERYKDYHDPWGFNLDLCEKAMRTLFPIYRSYFKVRVFGQENVKDRPYIVVSNHTGQLPIDAMLLTMCFAMDIQPPRVLRAMIERFMAQLPFLGDLTAQTGSILGDRRNCHFLLDQGESILVFPEGVRGISKSTKHFYQLQPFSEGFYRIAIQKKNPILPVCVIGAEEMFPFVWHSKKLARFFKLPALPLTPHYFPLPSPIDIHIGEEISIPENIMDQDSEIKIKNQIHFIEEKIKDLIKTGLEKRRPFMDAVRKPISHFFMKNMN